MILGEVGHMKGQEVNGNSVLSTQFGHEPITPLKKIKSISEKKEKKIVGKHYKVRTIMLFHY